MCGWWVLRYINHKSKLFVCGAIVLFLSLCTFAFLFNLLIAHYREALVIDPDDAARLAVTLFTEGLLSVSDFESWLLFVAGIVFFSFAAFKGYGLDDAYPGYGSLTRRLYSLRGDHEEHKQFALEELDQLHEEHTEFAENKVIEIERSQDMLGGYVSSYGTQFGIYQSHIKSLYNNLAFIITSYRDANTSERNTPKPEYFDGDLYREFDLHVVDSNYDDKRKEFFDVLEGIHKSLPEKRAEMLRIKENVQADIENRSKL